MAFKIFGFTIGRDVKQNYDTPIAPSNLDATIDIHATVGGGVSPIFSATSSLDTIASTENQQIEQYRALSLIPEVEKAIEEIVSESIITDRLKQPITLNCDEAEIPPQLGDILQEEMKEALRLLSFNSRGLDIFRRWYIDGRLNYQVLINEEQPQLGIQELRYIDPRKIKRVRELIKVPDIATRTEIIKGIREYYLFSENGMDSITMNSQAIQMTTDSVIFVHSGRHDPSQNTIISYLHPAIRPSNNLRMMEDSMVIYRLVRAPDRRVFKVYTGGLPAGKAEQFVQEVANKHKNKIVYDAATGAIRNDKRYLAMTEDYFLPVGEGGAGTSIETLEGGQAVGETGEADYFRNKLYEALRVPSSRMSDQPSLFSAGTEVTRDEIRFSRFIAQLRKRFSGLFVEIIRRNVILKGIMTVEEFTEIEDQLYFDYIEDNYFAEAMDANILQQKLAVLQAADPFVGKYLSIEYVFRDILKLNEQQIEQVRAEIEQDRQIMLDQEIQDQQLKIAAGIEPTVE